MVVVKLFNRVRQAVSGAPGTGDVVLGTVASGYQSFSDGGAVAGDLVRYWLTEGTIWEVGTATYSATGPSLTGRTVIENSSNSGTPLSFTSSATVFSDAATADFKPSRDILTATRTYYVRTDGSDSNTGLVNSAGGALRNIQTALNRVATDVDAAGQSVIVQVGDGTYTENLTLPKVVGSKFKAPVLRGNVTTPASVVLNGVAGTSQYTISLAGQGLDWKVEGFKVSHADYACIAASEGSRLTLGVMEFGAAYWYHLIAVYGSTIKVEGNYTISGGAQYHAVAVSDSVVVVLQTVTVTLTGTPAFGSAFVWADRQGLLDFYSVTFSGAATGKRFDIGPTGIVSTGATVNQTFFPGSIAGTSVGINSDEDNTVGRTRTKRVIISRDMTAASGLVAYTGLGFKPSALIAFGLVGYGSPQATWGMGDTDLNAASISAYANGGMTYHGAALAILWNTNGLAADYQLASVSSLDADGFTLSWAKGGTPAANTATIYVLAIR